MLTVLPMFSTQMIPVQLRIALGALVALIVTPMFAGGGGGRNVDLDSGEVNVHGSERRIAARVHLSVLFYALEIAGGFIATEMGLTLPSESASSSPARRWLGLLLYWIAMMTMLSLDLHHWMIVGFQKTYVLIPIGGAPARSPARGRRRAQRKGLHACVADRRASDGSFVLITLVFAVLGRAVPQMNVFSESFPVRTLLGLVSFGLTCTFMGQHIANYLRRLPEDMLNVARLAGS